MQIVSMPRLGDEFNPDMEEVARLLPDVKYIELEFQQPSRSVMMLSHYATIARFRFQNERTMAVPGYMLWKFLDMIPDGLGNQEHGYFDVNPYSADHPEHLMRRIRAAYGAMFASRSPSRPPPPIAATLSVPLKDFIATYPAKLPDHLCKLIAEMAEEIAVSRWPVAIKDIRKIIADALSAPRLVLKLVPVGRDKLGNQYVEELWGDTSGMTVKEFMLEFSTEMWATHPAHMTQMDVFTHLVTSHEIVAVREALKKIKKTAPDTYKEMMGALGITHNRASIETVAGAFAKSQDADCMFNILWSRWYSAIHSLLISEA